MKKTLSIAALATIATTLFASSLFADIRHLQATSNVQQVRYDGRHQTVEGRIRDISRDRNGFVIWLDRQNVVLFAPVQTEVRYASSRKNTRVRDLQRGDMIRASGSMDRRGTFHVNRIDFVRDNRSQRYDTFAGVVERIDARRGLLEVRDGRSRRVIAVDLRGLGRDSDLRNLRRGDAVIVTGEWSRSGFDAVRVEIARRR
ncbi:MAG TPA: hypothetical protein VF701_17005 [Thermoanaerobaculia bacterium]